MHQNILWYVKLGYCVNFSSFCWLNSYNVFEFLLLICLLFGYGFCFMNFFNFISNFLCLMVGIIVCGKEVGDSTSLCIEPWQNFGTQFHFNYWMSFVFNLYLNRQSGYFPFFSAIIPIYAIILHAVLFPILLKYMYSLFIGMYWFVIWETP